MTRWMFSFGQWMLGASGAADLLWTMQCFTLSAPDGSRYLEKVRCPVMVTGARQSLYSPGLGFNEFKHIYCNLESGEGPESGKGSNPDSKDRKEADESLRDHGAAGTR
ncbi:alpha/beta-hydrolase [Penicillium cinerascens]|uniref:Alpha/beta-hydrolase n=1 Tax=Penicillium cinerascens TaxID=70096 RepID=A0A9W9SZW6_9EURO|nr:alpha/beta-hydrolase [Penicillium cinerascens]KAJ5203840.1 alpha/beta-hydrolase [Penicillium cinerascens]